MEKIKIEKGTIQETLLIPCMEENMLWISIRISSWIMTARRFSIELILQFRTI